MSVKSRIGHVFDVARKIATGTYEVAKPSPEEAVQEAPPHHDYIDLESFFTKGDAPAKKAIVIPAIMDGWSLVNKHGGHFVAVQAVMVSDTYLEFAANKDRPKIFTGRVISINLQNSYAIVNGSQGEKYMITLGRPTRAYADFYQRTRSVSFAPPLRTTDWGTPPSGDDGPEEGGQEAA